ncbi:MAG: GntR family transcriptional regulator [Spirochaetota bacterium]
MKKSEQRFQNLSEFLFDKIAEKILSGEYEVGQKLIETDVMEEFSVSKSPVREALQGLMKVGLVEYRPRRGCYVKTISTQDVLNHFVVRTTVEGLAARLAYERVGTSAAAELKKFYGLMKEAAEKKDLRSFLDSHDQFHEFFAEKSENEILADFCKSLRIQNIRYRLQFININMDFDLHTHDDLVAHMETKDLSPEKYGALMEEHIKAGLVNFQKTYGKKKA